MPARRWQGLAWMALPFMAYLAVLRLLWFDTPIWDDYDAILESVARLLGAESPREWWGVLVSQHNEHRIAVVRFTAWALASVVGTIDIRALVVIGNFTVAGILLLAWAEFRDVVAPPLFAAAALLMFQWSYYEAALMGSAALPNLGVVFFSFASLFFATRAGAATATACVAFGILAAGSQANGLFALPLAALGCVLGRRWSRAVVFAVASLALWLLYFLGYIAPAKHPPVLAALTDPLGALQLFTMILGGVWPVGVLLLGLLAWLGLKGVWRTHPTAALWVAFVLLSAAAATAGRIGFGVLHQSRYAIYSTSLAVVAFLAVCAVARPSRRTTMALAIAGAAGISLAVSWLAWPRALEYSAQGRLLFKKSPPPPALEERYVGILYPSIPLAAQFLATAETGGYYVPRVRPFGTATLRTIAALPASARVAGHVDQVLVRGPRLHVVGWTDLLAETHGRVFSVFPGAGNPSQRSAFATPRLDVAKAHGDDRLLYAGFALDLDYASEEEARRAAPMLCVVVEAPGFPVTVVGRTGVDCRRQP